MTAPPQSLTGTPRKLLLATDLSARCDRALERAVTLAAGWEAALTILHVFEEPLDQSVTHAGGAPPSWSRPPDAELIAKHRIRQGLRADLGDAVARAAVLIEGGRPEEVIEQVASDQGSDLIVTGIARESPFARRPVILGKTVDRLLRRSPVPILVVKNRAYAHYAHIVVATDFSDTSGHALQAALCFFPFHTLHLLHAFEAPHAGAGNDSVSFVDKYRNALADDMETFLNTIFIPLEQRRRLKPLIERGRPGELVRQYVGDLGADLVVLGTHGRGALGEALLGSTAKSILSVAPCDALIVRGPRATALTGN